MYTLEGVSGVANIITAYEASQYTETPIFLSVVCSLFPKAIFLTFIILETEHLATYVLYIICMKQNVRYCTSSWACWVVFKLHN